MTYRLKTTGIAANVRFLICVDPDDGVVKHYAPANVDGYAVTQGSNVTIGEQTFDGITRKYWQRGAGTADADFVKFTSNKPNWTFGTAAQQRSIVVIQQHAAATGAYASIPFDRIASYNYGIGGNTYPYVFYLGHEQTLNGGQAIPASTKIIWGMHATHGTSYKLFWDTDTGTTISESTHSPTWFTGTTWDFNLDYVDRQNATAAESTGRPLNHAIIAFDDDLTTAEIATLRDDFFTVLLEASGGAAFTMSTGRRLVQAVNRASTY